MQHQEPTFFKDFQTFPKMTFCIRTLTKPHRLLTKATMGEGQRNCGNFHLSIERVFMNGVEIDAKISNSLLYTYLLFLQSDCKIL